MAHEARLWMEYAENDLAVAKHLMATFRPVPVGIVCYHCQQAAEKAFKAAYIALGVPKKHDLSFLLEQMRRRVSVTEDMLDHADELNAFSVAVRYPSELKLDEQKAVAAIRYADEMTAWAKDVLVRTLNGA